MWSHSITWYLMLGLYLPSNLYILLAKDTSTPFPLVLQFVIRRASSSCMACSWTTVTLLSVEGFLSRTLMPHKHVVAVNLLPRRCRIVHMEHLSRINRCIIKKTSKFKCISNLHGSHVLLISEMFLNYL